MKQWLDVRIQNWLSRRLPPSKQLTLDQRRIFIFPSRAGFGFLLLLLLLLLAAINYQNNMIFALAFLLVSIFVISIVHSFLNIAGMRIEVLQAAPGFVGDQLACPIKLIAPAAKRQCFDVSLTAVGLEPQLFSLLQPDCQLSLYWRVLRRGLFKPPRILLESYYPLGLLRTWTWLSLDMECLVYPQPLAGPYRHDIGHVEQQQGQLLKHHGSSEFYGLRDYQVGDNPRHIAWQAYAKDQGLFTKQFADYQHQQHWLSWQGVEGSVEQRLSILCHWILQFEQLKQPYGLLLPGVEIAPNLGQQHQHTALRALALFSGTAS